MADPTTFSLIDGDRMLMDGIAAWCFALPDLRVIHACHTVADLLADEPSPADVVLLDLRLPDHTDPVDNIRRLAGAGRRVLAVSRVSISGEARAARGAGASGYLTKDRDLAALAEAIRRIAQGGSAYPPDPAHAERAPDRTALTAKERALVLAYASGLTMAAAARRVGVRPSTAKTYLERIKKKYADAGRPTYTKLDLAARAREDGLWR